MKKIAYLGTKEIGQACLEHLLSQRDILGVEIVALLTNNRNLQDTSSKTVADMACQHCLPIIDTLDEYLDVPEVDIAISIQYHQIFKPIHILKARERTVNLHMAPLPEYRGCNQFSWAIINGDKEFGTTLHEVDEGIDSGPILAERRFEIPESCFVKELYQQTFDESKILFKEALPGIIKDELIPVDQSTIKSTRSELHYRREIEELKRMNPDWDGDKLQRHIRATAMPGFSPPYIMVSGKKVNLVLADE